MQIYARGEFLREVKKLAEKEDADMRYVSSIGEVIREETRRKDLSD